MNNYQLSVKSYPVYKDSGAEWLGDVPEHWEVKMLKNIVDICGRIGFRGYTTADIVLKNEGAISLSPSNIVGNKITLEKCTYLSWIKYAESPEIQIKDNDIIFVKTGSTIGKVALVGKISEPMTINPQLVVFKTVRSNPVYLFYFMQSFSFLYEIFTATIGGATQALSQADLGSTHITYPPISEQKLIAHYLDTKTAQCDRKIDLLTQKATQYGKLKQSLINETVTRGLDKSVLKKDSGVEWIGEVPEHWEVVRNKQIFQERSILSSTGKETLLTVSHITGVTPRSEKNVNMFMAETMEGYKICHQGDLIINTMWAWMGALGTSKYFGICSPAYNVYMPVNNVPYDYRYFDYLYRTPNAVVEMTRNSKGIVSSRLRLYAKEFFQIETPLPPVSEQKAIADYLDKKTAQIDQIIQTINTQIEKLKELRKTLINDVVTGKIRV